MSDSRNKTPKKSADSDKLPPDDPVDSDKLELPDPDTIIAEVTLVSPTGKKYQIIKTTERDEYEETKAEKKRGNRHQPE